MNIPSVLPIVAGESYHAEGIDLHELCSLMAFQSLLSKHHQRHSSSDSVGHLARQAWGAADAWMHERRPSKPPAPEVADPVELLRVVEQLAAVPHGDWMDERAVVRLIAKARHLVAAIQEAEGGVQDGH